MQSITNPMAIPISSSQINVSWSYSSGYTPISAAIYYFTDASITYTNLPSKIQGDPTLPGQYAFAPIPNGILSWSFTGLNASTTYYFIIDTAASGGQSVHSNRIYATTSAAPPPSQVTNAGSTNITTSGFRVTWTNPIDPSIVSYTIIVATDSGLLNPVMLPIENISNSATYYDITGLNPGTNYYAGIISLGDLASDPVIVGPVTTSSGGGGSGDPYMTTMSGTSYKLPTLNGAVRIYQGEVAGKTLTVNATLRTMPSTELQTQNLRSAIELSKTMSAKKITAFMKGICEKEETLCFFENFYIQHGEKVLAMNVWDQKFKVLHYTGGFETAALKNGDAALAASGIYTKYTGNTIKITVAKGAEIFVSCYNSPLVRSGIFVNALNMAEGNGAVVNVLSAADMTLESLDSLVAVPRRDAKALRMKREMFADHDGTRIRNVVTTM